MDDDEQFAEAAAFEMAEMEPVCGEINRFKRLTRAEDERGLALSVAAFAEDLLGRLLLAYLRGGKVALELVDGFNAPLGTFSLRIKACLAVGILSADQHKDLETARKIRNEFAHNWEGCSLSNQKISAWITNMTVSRISRAVPSSNKEKFLKSMTCILIELTHLLLQIRKGSPALSDISVSFSNEPLTF